MQHHHLHFRISRFYFIYYFFVGAFVPYWGLYLQSESLSAADIGILMSLFQISRIFAPNFWGWLADHTAKRTVWILSVSYTHLDVYKRQTRAAGWCAACSRTPTTS